MKTSENGKNLIKSFEGCKYRPYKLNGEVLYTVGYGHTGTDVQAGYTYTKAQIDKWFDSDIEKFEKLVEKYNDEYHWNQNEFDALVSFAYNTGSIDYLTARGTRTRDEIKGVWLMYCHDSTGNKLEGLLRRRKQELTLFVTPVDVMLSTVEVIPHE